MTVDVVTGGGLDRTADPSSYPNAILNILADFTEDRVNLAESQRAVLNILEDFAAEKARLELMQKAVLNILEDFDEKKNEVEKTNRQMAGEIADRKRAEQRVIERTAQLEAANKELEAFSYTVSHDLRAPVRAMDGFSRILLEEHSRQLSDEGRRYLNTVRDNAQAMGHLVDDLLTFSRLGRQPPKKQRLDPADIARQALEELRSEQEGRRVDISMGDLPACRADPALLRQVFVNLLSNALKFTRQQDVARIDVGCQQTADGPAYFVRDNGVGFDMRYASKLFGVFQRLHSSAEYEGTGAGLAIVQRIVHRHGGRVWAEAEPDRGATFYFTLKGGPDG